MYPTIPPNKIQQQQITIYLGLNATRKCMHASNLECNTPALGPSVRMRVATSGQPSPPPGRSVNLAQHICTSPAPSLIGAVGDINEIVASARNSNQIWKRYMVPQTQCISIVCLLGVIIVMSSNTHGHQWKCLTYFQPCI